MPKTKYTMEEFWWFHNTTCWRIKRCHMRDIYLYTPTMRYIYNTGLKDQWMGTKDPTPLICLNEEEQEKALRKMKTFKSEDKAVRWLAGIK